MDRSKTLFRSKLREAAQKREKRIDSPLVRYNEYDQPVCRVCNATLKSESLWPAHQASKKHHEAIERVKATAAGQTRGSNTNVEPPADLHRLPSSSTLPANFFDNQGTKRQKKDKGAEGKIQSVSSQVGSGLLDHPHGKKEVSTSVDGCFRVPESVKKTNDLTYVHGTEVKERSENKFSAKLGQPLKNMDDADAKQVKEALPESFLDNKGSKSHSFGQLSHVPRGIDSSEIKQVMRTPPDTSDSKAKIGSTQSNQLSQPSNGLDSLEAKQAKGALPEGFFDNKDADLRARGIEPVKVDVNDAYKEFEKEIQDNLQDMDDRLEEEEIDAAEVREEFESLEHKALKEQVEMVKKNLIEAKAARLAREQKALAFMGKESSDESSSGENEDDDDDDDFAVDWRAKHF